MAAAAVLDAAASCVRNNHVAVLSCQQVLRLYVRFRALLLRTWFAEC